MPATKAIVFLDIQETDSGDFVIRLRNKHGEYARICTCQGREEADLVWAILQGSLELDYMVDNGGRPGPITCNNLADGRLLRVYANEFFNHKD